MTERIRSGWNERERYDNARTRTGLLSELPSADPPPSHCHPMAIGGGAIVAS